MRLRAFAAITFFLLLFAVSVQAQTFIPGDVVIRWRPGVAAGEKAAMLAQARGRRRSEIARTHVELVRVAPGEEGAAIARYRRNPNVISAEPNYIRSIPPASLSTTDVVPGDHYFTEQWALHNTGQPFYCIPWIGGQLCLYAGTADADVDAPEGWPLSNGGQNVKVAVIDSGVDYTHPDLAANYDGGYDFVHGDTDPMDDHGHGTHVAGTIAAAMNNLTGNPADEEGVVGVAPNARILAYKVCAADGTCSDFAIQQAIAQAIADGARVINMSLGGPDFSQSTYDAIQEAWNAGLVIVAAAGNDGTTAFTYPAAYDHVVSVAAFDEDGRRAPFSNYGGWVDLSAPGNVIISSYPMSGCSPSTLPGNTGCYARNSGTSMATPHAAGAAALLWGRGDLTTNSQVVDALLNSADPQGVDAVRLDSWTIHGGLNLYNAMSYGLTNLRPVADAGPDQTLIDEDGDGVVLVSLDGNGSHDADGTIAGYEWREGTTVLASSAAADVWLSVGTHAVTLTVTDDGGDTGTDDVVVTINAPSAPPVAADVSAATVTGAPVVLALSATDDAMCDLAFVIVQGPSSGTLSPVQNQPCVPGTPNRDTASITYTAGATAGTFTFTYKANDGTNDSSPATVTVIVDAPADLVLSSLSAPLYGGAGEPLDVTDTTTNEGSGSAPASVTGFYLSNDYQWDPSDVTLGTRNVPALAAGAVSSASTTVVVPAGTATGTYYLLAIADAASEVTESKEYNNRKFRSLRVGPDLIVSTVTAPASAGAGGAIAVSDTTTNQGGGSAGASATAYYLSANTTLDAGDVYLGSRAVPSLAANAASTGSTTVTIPAGTPTGSYRIIAVADSGTAIAETTETNNTKYSTSTVDIGADLVVTSMVAPAVGGAGDPIVVDDVVQNDGQGASPASTSAFYLSLDSRLDASDPLLGTRSVPALAAGASSAASTSVNLPAGIASGNYYVMALADANSEVGEADEGNNTRRSGLIRIGPNLVSSALTVSPNKQPAGQPFPVTDTVANIGGGTAGASVTKLYLSTDLVVNAGDVLLGTRVVPALAPDAVSVGTTTIVVPAGTPPGVYKILAEADGGYVVDETSESNTRAAYLQVLAP